MNSDQAYRLVNDALFKDKSCKFDNWYTIVVNERPLLEACINKKGYIHVRKPIKKVDWYTNRNDLYLYERFRFTNKKELVSNGTMEDTRPSKEDIKAICI